MPLIYVKNTGTNNRELLNTDLVARITPRTIEGGSAIHMANGTIILVSDTLAEIEWMEKNHD